MHLWNVLILRIHASHHKLFLWQRLIPYYIQHKAACMEKNVHAFNWRIILLKINLRKWFHFNVQSIHAHNAKLHAWLMHVHYNPSASINPAAKKKLLLLVSLSCCCWWTLYRSAHTTGSWARGERGNLILALAPFLSRLFTCGWLLCSVRRELRDKGKELLICWCASLRHRLRRCILTKLMRNTTHKQPHWWDAHAQLDHF